mmetsp:Transcript_14903/g.21034  ORF Transcript_14903/g.21034 Transcript_14903/m.21034 type:complete len:255 (-) Transcript_14903:42-806(-)
MTAAVHVIKFGLGDRVVDVDGREKKRAGGSHGVQAVDTSGGFFRNTMALGSHLGPLLGVNSQDFLEELEDDLEFGIVGGVGVRDGTVLLKSSFGFHTFVDEEGSITTIVDDEVGASAARPREGLVGAPPVFFESFSFPSKDVGSLLGNDGGGGVVLSREDVAGAPTDSGAKSSEGLDEDRSLDSHVQRAGNEGTFKRLTRAELLDARHESRHFDLSNVELLAAEFGKRHVGNSVVAFDGGNVVSRVLVFSSRHG